MDRLNFTEAYMNIISTAPACPLAYPVGVFMNEIVTRLSSVTCSSGVSDSAGKRTSTWILKDKEIVSSEGEALLLSESKTSKPEHRHKKPSSVCRARQWLPIFDLSRREPAAFLRFWLSLSLFAALFFCRTPSPSLSRLRIDPAFMRIRFD